MADTAAPQKQKVVYVQTSDNVTLKMDRDVAERSVLIKNLLEDLGDSEEPIPIQNVCIDPLMSTTNKTQS
jgi:S-phase kinase-associated protein 1